MMALWLEVRCRRGGDGDSCIRLTEIIHAYRYAAHSGVVEIGQSLVKPLEYHEMVEVPVDNGGSQWLEMFDVGLPSVGIQSVLSGCQHHVAGVAAVTGYATIGSQLLQRQPFAVIGK